jgi:DNA replication protein DnaC
MEQPNPMPSNGENSPKIPNPSPPGGAAPLPDAERMFAWAAGEARRNADRHEASDAKPPRVKPDLREQIMRLAQSDREETAVRDRLAAREAQRRREFTVESLIETNGVPPKYRGATFDGFAAVPAEFRDAYFAASQDLRSLEHRPGIVVLLGRRGAGKTYLACALVNYFCGQCRHAVYAEAMDYFLRLDGTRRSWRRC